MGEWGGVGWGGEVGREHLQSVGVHGDGVVGLQQQSLDHLVHDTLRYHGALEQLPNELDVAWEMREGDADPERIGLLSYMAGSILQSEKVG